jgi:hypothetical protein
MVEHRATRRSSAVAHLRSPHSSQFPSFPRAQTTEEFPRENLPGVRQDQVQAFRRLAIDREHVVAYTHDATFSAGFEPIHLVNQHDQVSYFHFGGIPFGGSLRILFARRRLKVDFRKADWRREFHMECAAP